MPDSTITAFSGIVFREASLGDQGGFLWETAGAGEGIRTLDPNLGKVVLYP